MKLKLPYEGNYNLEGNVYVGALFNLAVHSGLPLMFCSFGMDAFFKYKFVVS